MGWTTRLIWWHTWPADMVLPPILRSVMNTIERTILFLTLSSTVVTMYTTSFNKLLCILPAQSFHVLRIIPRINNDYSLNSVNQLTVVIGTPRVFSEVLPEFSIISFTFGFRRLTTDRRCTAQFRDAGPVPVMRHKLTEGRSDNRRCLIIWKADERDDDKQPTTSITQFTLPLNY
jgi:hypothetical protein